MSDTELTQSFTGKALSQAILQGLSGVFPKATTQLQNQLSDIQSGYNRGFLFKVYASIPSKFANSQISVSNLLHNHELSFLDYAQDTNWSPSNLARIALLLGAEAASISQYQESPHPKFYDDLALLFRSADLDELVLLYRNLDLFSNAQLLVDRAREGARSNMLPVFCAVAHNNAFAYKHFDDEGWNQLILKAVFNDCRLTPIIGLQDRLNPDLTRMICNYTRERWIAGRQVPWDIWRAVDPEDETALTLLINAILNTPGELANGLSHFEVNDKCRLAAALVLSEKRPEKLSKLSNLDKTLANQLKGLDWNSLSTYQ